jgi:hypothetical protein
MRKELALESSDHIDKIVNTLKDFISEIPSTIETEVKDPSAHSREIANKAAAKAALISGGLALPPGPLGIITIMPDIVAVWKIQAQMVADIAGTFGKTLTLSQEQMLYCLFKHTASQAVRDLVVRVGERFIIKRASLRVIQKALQKVGVKITQRLAGKLLSRWLPIAGAIGVGAYAFYDTAQVAKTTMELMSKEIQVEREEDRK